MRRVLRHVVIVFLLGGIATSNLAPVLWPGAGALYRALGLRQFWSMFAPNPVHDARFVEADAVTDAGRVSLDIGREPPADGFFFAWGYDRIHKLHKQVALHPDRYAPAYAAALCRVHDVHGAIELRAIHRVPPTPSRALAGARPTRTVTPLGSWPCP